MSETKAQGANAFGIDAQSFRPFLETGTKKPVDVGPTLGSPEEILPEPTLPPATADPTGGESFRLDPAAPSLSPHGLTGREPPISMDEIPPAPPSYDSWELEEQLRHIDRLLATTVLAESERAEPAKLTEHVVEPNRFAPKTGEEHVGDRGENSVEEEIVEPVVERRIEKSQDQFRLDAAHRESAQRRHLLAQQRRASRRASKSQVKRGRAKNRQEAQLDVPLHRVTWGLLSVGLAIFACGGLLLIWSAWTGRQDLWTIGWPITMIGQTSLAFGGILLAERLWHESSATAAKLDNVDQRLADLKDTTLEASSGNEYTVHPPQESSPRLLLADLKSQIDELSVKLDQEVDDSDDLI